MEAQQIDILIEKLRKRIADTEYVNDLDAMIDARNALRTWRKNGGEGAPPCEDDLRQWGLLEDEVQEAPHVFSVEEASLIFQHLLTLVGQLSEEAEVDQMLETVQRLREWKKAPANAPLPDADQLAAWGVWPAPVDQSARPAPAQPIVVQAEIPASVRVSASPPAPVEEVPADPDDRYQRDYDLAIEALNKEQYFQARNAFRTLNQLVNGRLRVAVDAGLGSAETGLARATDDAIAQARAYEARAPKDLPGQEAAWRAVLKINPDSEDAQHTLVLLAQSKVDSQLRREIDTILPAAEAANKANDLPKLNDLLGKVRGWKAKGEKEAPEISPDLYAELIEIEKQVDRLRQKTRQILGQASTYITGGNLRDAYRSARQAMDSLIPTMVDESGVLGDIYAGQEVETPVLFKAIRKLFIDALKDLASQRINEASGQEKHDPESAKRTLEDAVSRLTDDVLTEDDKTELVSHLVKVKEKLQGVRDRLDRYNDAKKEIIAAQAYGVKPAEALSKLRAAKVLYEDFPSVDTLIRENELGVAEVLAGDLLTAIASARGQIEKLEFTDAATTLDTARKQALEQVPHPEPGSSLAARLADLQTVEGELTAAQGRHQRLMETLGKVDGYFKCHTAGDPQALELARNLLNLLTPEEQAQPAARDLRAQLPMHQGINENWQEGQAQYRQGNWSGAVEALQQVVNKGGANHDAAQLLIDRATASTRVQEAEAARSHGAWLEAINKYREAQGLAESGKPEDRDAVAKNVLAQCEKGLAELAPLQANDESFEAVLQSAREQQTSANLKTAHEWLSAHGRIGLIETAGLRGDGGETALLLPVENGYQEAAAALEAAQKKAKTVLTTKGPEIETLLNSVRQDWIRTFMDAIGLALNLYEIETLAGAMLMARTLRSAGLLYTPLHRSQVTTLEERYLDVRYQQLVEDATVIDWAKVEDNRRKRLEPPHARTPEIEGEYRQAVRKRVESEVRDKQRQNPALARDHLRQLLQRPEMQGEIALHELAIELCWELGDWSGAQNVASVLAIRDTLLSDAWAGLTRAAQWFRNGFVAEGRAELALLKERYPANTKNGKLVLDKQDAFVRGALDALLTSAASAMQKQNDDGYIEAAEKYAQAAEFDPNDKRVITGLGGLGKKLGPGVKSRASQVERLKIGQRGLEEAVKEAEKLDRTLSAIKRVAPSLSLETDVADDLSKALDDLKPKVQRWRLVDEYLKKAQVARENALSAPQPLGQGGGQGGWDFGPARSSLLQAQTITTREKDTEAGERVKAELEALQRLEDRATELFEHLTNFMTALHNDSFDVVISEASQLLTLWDTCVRDEYGWKGLSTLVTYRHPYQGQITTLEQHREKAQERKGNLEAWQAWASQAGTAYQTAVKACKEVKRDLDILRQEQSLEEIVNNCRNAKHQCDNFEDSLEEEPEVGTLSAKAAAEQQKVQRDSWRRELLGDNGARVKAELLRKAAEQEMQRLTHPLARLNQIMAVQIEGYLASHHREKIPPAQNVTLAENQLKLCQEIDPLHRDVTKAQQRLNQLKSGSSR